MFEDVESMACLVKCKAGESEVSRQGMMEVGVGQRVEKVDWVQIKKSFMQSLEFITQVMSSIRGNYRVGFVFQKEFVGGRLEVDQSIMSLEVGIRL